MRCSGIESVRCVGVAVIADHARVLSKVGLGPGRAVPAAVVEWALAKHAVSERASSVVGSASVAVSESLHKSQRGLAVERALGVLSHVSGEV